MDTTTLIETILSFEDSGTVSHSFFPLGVIKGVRHFRKARIASDLTPLVDRKLKSDSTVYIVGNDGPNLDKSVYPKWCPKLQVWRKRGVNLTYLLLDPTPQALENLDRLAKVQCRGCLKVFRPAPLANIPQGVKALLKDWETTHFAIFENPSMLWVESNHPKGKTEAEDCYFYPEKVVAKSKLLDIYKRRMRTALEYCGAPVVSSE